MLVGHHLIADILRPSGDDLEHLRRQPGLIENVGKGDRGKRCQLGRLAHHAVIGGDRRRDLVRHHVQRVVKGRDGGDGTHRLALGEDLARFALGREIAGEDLPVIKNGELAGQREHVIGPPGLVKRVLLADAELERQHIGYRLAAFRGSVHRL